MIYREALPADAKHIVTVLVDSMRAAYRGILPSASLDQLSYEKSESSFRAKLEAGGDVIAFVAAEADDSIVGYAVAGPEKTRGGEYDGEILDLYFLKEHQGRGYGRALMLACVERMPSVGMTSMPVWVLAENPARTFYEAQGGSVVRERTLTIGGRDATAVAYAWSDLQAFATAERARGTGETLA